ncbi:MAG: hypothetical protein KYX62_09940 [Pseudomonadota bacterium]|nr:hypothetical protein [Pseudomonadota bacterium]
MQNRYLTLSSVIAATAALTACGGSSSSSSSDDAPAATVYMDTGWSAGSDELVGLTYPQGATDGALVALKRSDNGDGTFSHSLMLAESGSKEFSDSGITLERDYYRDVLALPVTVTVDGEELDTVIVATCGYDEAGVPDGAEVSGGGVSAQIAAEDLPDAAALEFYVAGTDISASINLSDDAVLYSCYSLGGLMVSDTADKGGSEYEVDFWVSGAGSEGRGFVFGAGIDFDYSVAEISYASASLESSFPSVGAVDNGDDDLIMTVNDEGDTLLYDYESGEFILETAGNIFTSATDNGAEILDIAVSGDDLFAVSADEGLAGGDFSGEEFVLLSGGDFEHCVDALAVNGTTLWCHDATDEGKLIEFTAPDVPQSEVEETLPVAAAMLKSDSLGEQIKAELEGAGAEVEVK